MKKIVPAFIILFVCSISHAQSLDTLPKFSVRNTGNNKYVISWVNNFKNIRQISIQRSLDSLKGYRTILTVPDPTTPENGFVDTRASNDHNFYRLYIMLEKGVYFFSPVKKPFYDSIAMKKKILIEGNMDKSGSLDSLNRPNLNVKEKIITNSFIASKYVYTYQDGYVRINLPEDENLITGKAKKKYTLKFFDDKDNLVFELKEIKLRNFKIDKSNFYRSGWFKFELYEDGKLFEKHKFFIPKEF